MMKIIVATCSRCNKQIELNAADVETGRSGACFRKELVGGSWKMAVSGTCPHCNKYYSDTDYAELEYKTKKVTVTIEELISQNFEIEVPENASEEDAMAIGSNLYRTGKLVLDNPNLVEANISSMQWNCAWQNIC